MSLAMALEKAASALDPESERIRDANGDPGRLRRSLDAAQGARVLGWLLAHEPDAGEDLADAWAEEPEGIAYVLGVEEKDLPKDGRKRLRRVQHRLRGRGIAVPRPEPAPVTATLKPADDVLEAALISPLDPSGARLSYLVEPNPAGGTRIFELIFDSGRGLLECSVYTAGRGGARRFLKEAGGRQGAAAIPLAPDSLRKLLARAAEVHPPERPLPRGFSEWRGHLTAAAPGAKTPGELVREALGSEGGSVARAVALIRSREIGPWPPPEGPLRSLAERLQGLAEAKLVVSGAQKQQQIDAALNASLEEILDAAGVARTVSRFEETAYVFWKQGREDDARACLAAAGSMGDTGGGDPVAARALLEATIGPLLDRLREEEDSSLIVKP